jgi:hypothetical protein
MLDWDIICMVLYLLSYFVFLYCYVSRCTPSFNSLGNPQRKTRTSFRDLGEALAAGSG